MGKISSQLNHFRGLPRHQRRRHPHKISWVLDAPTLGVGERENVIQRGGALLCQLVYIGFFHAVDLKYKLIFSLQKKKNVDNTREKNN